MTGANRHWRSLEVPIRPGTGTPTLCPWGHDLAVAGVRQSWSQDYLTPEWLCEACNALPGRGGVWALVDPSPSRHVSEDQVDEYGLHLVLRRPPTPAGIGSIQLRLGCTTFGEVQLSLCSIDRRAILVHVDIEEKHRRRGAGSVLVAAAAARGSRYEWTTLPIDRDPTSVAFWARTGAPGPAAPRPCTHQLEAKVVPAAARWSKWW
ncbi:hypothetical protein [Amycolatopsis sp. lyj-84]|uniref:hypothetical protein n=1 Tax=Amycolatopsis sp. lyj-84 TaxID=2789284 RepID=UPI003977F380